MKMSNVSSDFVHTASIARSFDNQPLIANGWKGFDESVPEKINI
jgi:hypothetical protein